MDKEERVRKIEYPRIKLGKLENGKRQLVKVLIIEVTMEDYGSSDKKSKQIKESGVSQTKPDMVLEGQHHLASLMKITSWNCRGLGVFVQFEPC